MFSLFPPNTGIFVVSTVIFYMNVHVRKIALGINFTEYQIILQMYFLVQIIFRAVCIYHDFKQIVLPFTIFLFNMILNRLYYHLRYCYGDTVV